MALGGGNKSSFVTCVFGLLFALNFLLDGFPSLPFFYIQDFLFFLAIVSLNKINY
jgi:hypothetical protein